MSISLTAFPIESWLLYAVAISTIFLRIIFRRISLGAFSNFQSDDYIMIFVVFSFTASIITANQVVLEEKRKGSRAGIDPQVIGSTVWGLSMKFALEQFQLTTMWLVKACLIIMFRRIFHHARERQFLLGTAVICVLSYVLIQVLLLGVWCRPIQQYWDPSSVQAQCSSYQSHGLLTLSLSTTTTLLTSILPIPFIPTPRTILLALLTALGITILILSILARTYMLVSPSEPTYLYLYAAESATAIATYNLPFLFSLTSSHYRRHTHTHSQSHIRLPPTPPPTLASLPPSRVPTISLRQKRSSLSLSTLTLPHHSTPQNANPTSPPKSPTHSRFLKPRLNQSILSLATDRHKLQTISRRGSWNTETATASPTTTNAAAMQHQMQKSLQKERNSDDGWDEAPSVGAMTPPIATLRPTDPPLELLRELERRASAATLAKEERDEKKRDEKNTTVS